MPVSTYTVGPGSLVIGEVGSPQETAPIVTSCTLTPSVDSEDDIDVLSGDVYAGVDDDSFVLEGNLLQDISVSGFTTWCRTHRGETHPFVYIPNNVLERSVVGSIKIRALPVGGDVKKKATSDFEFPGVGDWNFADVAEG